MATVAQALTVATAELGYIETPVNITKYWAAEKPSYQGGAWCGAFVQWCLRKVGMALPLDNPYFVPYVEIWARSNGRWHDAGQAGDLVIFGTPGTYHTGQHIGFVEKPLGSGLYQTIEGNTSPDTRGSQNNGGGVYRRVRNSSWIRGFVRLGYDVAQPAPAPSSGVYLTEDGVLDKGTLKAFQKLWGLPKAQCDGVWGPQTAKACQSFARVKVDGEIGPITIKALQTRVSAPVSGSWAYASTKPDATTKAIEQYINRAIRRGTFSARW
jgi:hypothetical protein